MFRHIQIVTTELYPLYLLHNNNINYYQFLYVQYCQFLLLFAQNYKEQGASLSGVNDVFVISMLTKVDSTKTCVYYHRK